MKVVKKVKLSEPIDADKIKIKRDHYFPNAYIIDLPLDSTPGHVWQDILEREWKSSRHLWDRKLFVIGDKLRLVTPPSDIKRKIDWVREVIEQTNKSIDEYNQKAEARAAQIKEQLKRQALEKEKTDVKIIKGILRKKFGTF